MGSSILFDARFGRGTGSTSLSMLYELLETGDASYGTYNAVKFSPYELCACIHPFLLFVLSSRSAIRYQGNLRMDDTKYK